MNGQAERPDEEIDEQPVADEVSEAEVDAGEQIEDAEPEVSELEQAQAKADENWDHYLRTAAELENVRKRAARDVENAHRFALERFSKELLAVKDSLEMGLAAAEGAKVESLLEGSEATLKILGATMLGPHAGDLPTALFEQFLERLGDQRLAPIGAVVGADDQFVASRTHLVLPEEQLLVARTDDRDDGVASLF